MYEALDTRTGFLYSGKNIAKLREIIEAVISLPDDLPPGYYAGWSNSRRVIYLIQARYITPYSGPPWFMVLKPADASGEGITIRPRSASSKLSFVNDDGSLSKNGTLLLTYWPGRDHVQVVFKDGEEVRAEIFLTEKGLRKLWIKAGKVLGFSSKLLFQMTRSLPATPSNTVETPPERFHEKQIGDFDIFEAVEGFFDGDEDAQQGES